MNTPLIVMFTIAGLVVLATWLFGRDKTSTSPSSTSTPPAPSPAPATTPTTKMSLKNIQSWKSQLTSPLGAFLIIGLAGLLWFFFRTSYSIWQWTSNLFVNFHIASWKPGAWSMIVIGLIVATIVGILEFRGRDKNNSGIQEHWKKVRGHFYFAVLWTIIVAVLNVGLYYLDSSFWWGLWKFKGEGTWFFWLIQALLTAGMMLAVNQPKEAEKLRNCGIILVAFSLVFWTWAWAKSDGRPPTTASTTAPAVLSPIQVAAQLAPGHGPSVNWSADQTFPIEKMKWSPALDPAKYEADCGEVEVMLDGNPNAIRKWNTSAADGTVSFKVPSYVKFIQIRSEWNDITVYGTRYKKQEISWRH